MSWLNLGNKTDQHHTPSKSSSTRIKTPLRLSHNEFELNSKAECILNQMGMITEGGKSYMLVNIPKCRLVEAQSNKHPQAKSIYQQVIGQNIRSQSAKLLNKIYGALATRRTKIDGFPVSRHDCKII